MWEGAYKKLKTEWEKRTSFYKYGKLEAEHYPVSAIEDLVLENVRRAEPYKRNPKSLSNKVRYDFDQEGRLMIRTCYNDRCKIWGKEFFIYTERNVFRLFFYPLKNEGEESDSLGEIAIQTYQKNKIIKSVQAMPGENDISVIKKEQYLYKNEEIDEAWTEEYRFPCLESGDEEERHGYLRPRWQYFFEKDSKRRLCGFWRRTWYGDCVIREIQNALEIPPKKSASTGLDSWR